MVMKRTVGLGLLLLLGMSVPRPSGADVTVLLNRVTPLPNVLIIFDTSQSMTWYTSAGATRGDEYPGYNTNPLVPARMAMAKTAMTTVVDTYFDKLRLGLASYAENGTPANPNADVRIKRYHYYCTNGGTYCTNSSGSRQYITFTPPWSSLASGGATTTWNQLQLTVSAGNINMPSQNTFTLQWDLNPGVAPNPKMTGPFTTTSGGTPERWRCRWDVWETQYNVDGSVKTGYPKSTGPYYGAWTTGGAGSACPAPGTEGTLTQRETFNYRASGDDPVPYKYNVLRSWSGTAIYGVSNGTAAYASNLGAGWTDYTKRYYNPTYCGDPNCHQAAVPLTTSYYYRYTWYYKGTCTSGCTGYLTTTRAVKTATQPAVDPVPAAPAAPLAVPFNTVYTWSGNNYEIGSLPPAPANPENSCATGGFSGSGITVLVDVGAAADKNALKNYLGTGPDKTKELHGANYYTPLATALDTARGYFLDDDGPVQTDPQKDCRGNYLILVTDGGESCPLVPLTGAGSPGDKAAALLSAPVNALGGVPTYVVALDGSTFGQDEQAVLRDIAARGSTDGTGTYYSASSTAALQNALNAIIGSILAQQYTFVNPVVPTLRGQDNLMMIQGSFDTPTAPPASPNTPLWPGKLTAYALDSNGQIAIDALEISAPPLWEAGALLAVRAGATRTIKTVAGGALVDFLSANASVLAALSVTLDVNGDGAVNNIDQTQVVTTVRGPNPGGKGFLGDIFHSVPIVVGPPSPTYVDRTFDPANPTQLLSLAVAPDTFADFRAGAAGARQRLALVGANDGMLHAFNAGTWDAANSRYTTGDGAEVWAFIPPQMLPKLQMLAVNNGHQYYVDASPRVADVWLDANNDGVKAAGGGEWRTILIGGFRQGGSGLYALDVTNTASPSFMWTYNTTGQSWSEPAFGKVKVRIGGRLVERWVVFVGDGYDPAGVTGRTVHVIDVKTGKVLWQYATGSSVAAGPLVVDTDSDGYADRVYVGTLGGDMLRLDVSAVGKSAAGGDVDPAGGVMVATCPAASPNCWSAAVLFAGGAAQPMYTKVAATADPNGNLWVFFGSGDRSDPLLIPGTANRAYGIKDLYPTVATTLTEADLTNMTNNNTLDASAVTGSGWYLVMRAGEKEWAETSLVFNQQVFFTTFMPGNAGCGDVGSGSIYMVYYLTGGGVSDTALFTANPPQASSRIFQVNAGATSRPVVTTGTQGSNAVVYLGNSNMLTLTPSFSTPSSIRSTQYWRRVLP